MTDEPRMTPEEINKALFAQLVITLATSAMQQLGKLVNPVTHQAEISLEGAQTTIDLLDMLQAKTKGNLDKDEERMLRDSLMSCKMNFVEVMESDAGKAAAEPPPPAAPEPGKPADDKGPKFHKKYE